MKLDNAQTVQTKKNTVRKRFKKKLELADKV